MKKLLIFDAYGTLFSTGTGSIDATKEILSLQDKSISAVDFYRDWKNYHRKHMDDCNAGAFIPERDIFAKDLKCLYELYDINRPYLQDVSIMLDSLENRELFPEVLQAISELKQYYRVVIGSTTDTAPLLVNVKNNGLQVDAIYTSEIIRKYKPANEFYEYILQQENCNCEDAVFIGDSMLDDYLGPQRVGISAVLVDRGGKLQSRNNVRMDFVVNDLCEIKNILEGL